MYTITRTFQFRATHSHPDFPRHHPFRGKHSHHFSVTLMFRGAKLNQHNVLIDFEELADVERYLTTNFEGKHLNRVLRSDITTIEFLAKHLFVVFRREFKLSTLHAVTVSQRPTDSATYCPAS